MRPPALPSSFRVERAGARLLVARADVRAGAHLLGLLNPGGLARVLNDAARSELHAMQTEDAARDATRAMHDAQHHAQHATQKKTATHDAQHATQLEDAAHGALHAAQLEDDAHDTQRAAQIEHATHDALHVTQGRGRAFVVRWPESEQRVLLRRLWRGGLLGPLLGDRFLSPARPLRELAVTCALRAKGVALPEPLFMAGERRAGFWRLVFATRFEAETRDALAWLRARPAPDALRAGVFAAARSIRKLHDAGGVHPDLHLKNLLLRARGRRFEVIVVDLDAATLRARLTPRERMAQLMRLYRSLIKHRLLGAVGTHTPARFLRAYCGADRALEHALRARLRPELRRIALHRIGYALRRGATTLRR